ncbi:3-oxoacyl-ACP synthase III family protein [Sphingobacterium siyangense]|uniref:3-oxoacyl-ACP synthase III family protein n=1 Tax=Sphingobacterium siyangense TaxID=459529 RepID=UPI003DA48262
MDSYIKYVSAYLPSNTLTNEDITKEFPEWNGDKIFSKIGVKNRFIVKDDETVVDMAVNVVLNMVAETNLNLSTIDYLILCTQSPDFKLPTSACIIQDRLGLSKSCAAIDINQGCSGYIYGLSLADALVSSGNYKNVLLITAETYSKYIHKRDKANISLFGDAATATLISTEGVYRLGKFDLGTDGNGWENLILKNGGSRHVDDKDPDNLANFLHMNGGEIFDFTVKNIPDLVDRNLKNNEINQQDISLFVFHQANAFMLSFLRKRIGIPAEKFLVNMENYGNTVSSSIPLAFKDFLSANHKRIMFVGFGVGYSWGAVTLFK